MFVFVLYHGSRRRAALRAYWDYCAGAPDEVSSWAIAGTVPATEDLPEEVNGREICPSLSYVGGGHNEWTR